MKNLSQIIEAIIFASGTSKRKADLIRLLPDITEKDLEEALRPLREKYSGDSGILLLEFNGKIQMSTNPDYGVTVAEVLTPLKEKELSKVLLEVLAIIAYKQPITKLEIEKIKSSSAEYALGILLKVHLIEVVGRKDAVGKPVLYGTTDEFLKKFQLTDIKELPDYNAVLERLESLGAFNKSQIQLYREIDVETDSWEYNTENKDTTKNINEIEKSLDDTYIIDSMLDEYEIPDFLDGEDVEII